MRGRLFEVTPKREIVWQFVNPFFAYDERWGSANNVFRAYRYGPDFAGFQGKVLAPERHAWASRLYAGH